MAKIYNYDVMFDDTSIDVSKEVALVWSIANSLRGAYTSDKYKDVIIPMVILRRFECALAETKQAVVNKYKANPKLPAALLEKASGYPFYNTSEFTLARLLNDSDNIAENFISYIENFSANVQTIFNNLDFKKQIEKMDKNNRLYGVVKKFSEIDFDPKSIDGMKMGYIFEDIIRRFSENAEAGDHYTPREVIRLLVNILLAEGCNDLLTEEGKVATVLDAACGSGGMLSTTHDFLARKNPFIDVRLFGQEINPESYAICMADMLIKGEDARNIKGGDPANTLMTDCFPDQKVRLVIMNPPFGTAWGGKDAPDGQEKAVRGEFKKDGRFEHGLPGTGDAQLLFMQHAINKLDDKGRAAIISNGSPLFSGSTTSGESQIRRWMLEEDLLEAIIALPSQLFYNTDIGIYAFILSKNKRPDRRGKVQLINAVDMWKPLKKSLGKKRREIDRDSMTRITELYSNFEKTPESKIFSNEEFMYREYAVWQPLQRRAVLDQESIDRLRTSAYFTSNSSIFNEADFAELAEMNPRSSADEKKYQKYIAGRKFVADVLAVLEENKSDKVYMDYASFEKHLKTLIGDVDGFSASRLTSIAMILSVMDKTAVVQKDKKGGIITDPTTKDTEIIKLTKDPEEYFAEEVYPHVPDAIWRYEFDPSKKESATNKEKQGAEFPFARYFYEYKDLEKADTLLSAVLSQNTALATKIATLQKIGDSTEATKSSGIRCVGEIPESWDRIRTKHFSYMKGRIGWQGLTSDEFIEEGPFLVTGTDFESGRVCWERSYHVSEKRYDEAPEIQLQVGDLLVTKDGTIGKLAYIDELPGPASLNSHLLVMRPLEGKYTNRFLYWVLSSSVFVEYYGLVSDGSTMNSLSQEKMGNFTFPTPPVDEQDRIADYLDKQCGELDSIISDLEAQLETMKEYKKALIMECVTGKKRVKEAN